MKTICTFCEKRFPDLQCGIRHPKKAYYCTRRKGHKPPHIACGEESHKLAVWYDDGREPKVRVRHWR